MKKIFLLAAALALSACGFHLKGHSGIPDALPYQAWHVDGESLQQALEAALRRADGKPVGAPQAQATISVLRVDTKKICCPLSFQTAKSKKRATKCRSCRVRWRSALWPISA